MASYAQKKAVKKYNKKRHPQRYGKEVTLI